MACKKNVGRMALAAVIWGSPALAAVPNILYVDAPGANPLDALVLARLADPTVFPQGFNVTVRDTTTAPATIAADLLVNDLVIVSSTVTSGNAVTAFGGPAAYKTVNKPLMLWEDGNYDELQMRVGTGSGGGSNGYVDPLGISMTPQSVGNPLSGGLTFVGANDNLTPAANVAVYGPTAEGHMGYGQGSYGTGALKIGQIDPIFDTAANPPGTYVSVITYYEQGALLVDSTAAAARRLGFFGGDNWLNAVQGVNDNGKLIWDSGVQFLTAAEFLTSGGGSWATDTNWSKTPAGSGPSGPGRNVSFLDGVTAGTITLNGAQTAGVLRFKNTASYTVAPGAGGSLTLGDVPVTGPGHRAFITVEQGSHSITAPLSLPNHAFVTVNPSTSLTVSGAITAGAGKTLMALGGGTLNFGATQHLEGFNVAAGTGVVVTTSAGTSKALAVKVLTLGGSINLKNNNMIVGDDANPAVVADVRALITANQLTTDSTVAGKQTALGYAAGNDPRIAGLGGSLEGEAFQANAVIVKYTYVGDANFDGSVDGSDVALWAQNFSGALGVNPPNPRVWTQGDWNNDGSVDGSDVALWATNFTGALGAGGLGETASAAAPGIAIVPEPASFGLMAVGALLSLRRRRR